MSPWSALQVLEATSVRSKMLSRSESKELYTMETLTLASAAPLPEHQAMDQGLNSWSGNLPGCSMPRRGRAEGSRWMFLMSMFLSLSLFSLPPSLSLLLSFFFSLSPHSFLSKTDKNIPKKDNSQIQGTTY
uniref:Uncharacterized protein n=1 Tax=Pipistrellus kuhlii TaxID=59472 RepID=A0A7J7RF98_PIPKU|nr:hypothetical protein mPipKuh1_010563 [Pipistrellus kuhlii]